MECMNMHDIDNQLYSEYGNLENTKEEMNKVFLRNGPMAVREMWT